MGCNGSEACFLDFLDGLEGGYPRGTAVEILRQGGAQATVPASKWGVSGEKNFCGQVPRQEGGEAGQKLREGFPEGVWYCGRSPGAGSGVRFCWMVTSFVDIGVDQVLSVATGRRRGELLRAQGARRSRAAWLPTWSRITP